jgi:PAS domain-containing protein
MPVGGILPAAALWEMCAKISGTDNAMRSLVSKNFIEVNRSACEMLGFTRDELLKLNIADISENKPP